ncbi:glycerophosphodiester phosphodiesterase, partial [Lachnospiraceae bacterium OttesenSCG-928-D06]|nr:glycerophosphodiester phosphodiesterase [Lachnospiraceae bacterium OttesenSCG-928-D06]
MRYKKRILVGGHRGCICQYQENTIPAMEQALSDGADYLEIDLQLTKDGVIVVYHDTELSLKTSLHGYVHEYTLADLKMEIPTLNTCEEVFQWAAAGEVSLMLELKSVPLDMQAVNLCLTDKLAEMILRYQMVEQVLVFGADYMVLKHLKSVYPVIQIGLIVPYVPADPVALMKEMDATVYLSYIYNMTKEIVDDLHTAGYFVDGAILREQRWIERAKS